MSIRHTAAKLKEDDSMLAGPSANILFSPNLPTEVEQENLVSFICNELNISADQASALLKEEDFQTSLADENKFDWPTVGSFQKQPDGTILFTQNEALKSYLPAISLVAAKPVASPASVTETIKEEDTTGVNEAFEEPVKKDNWRVWATVIFVVSVLLISIYYFL